MRPLKGLNPNPEKGEKNGEIGPGLGPDHTPTIINIKVSHGLNQYEVPLPSNSSFGHLKSVMAQKTGLNPELLKLLFRGKQKEDNEDLQTASLKHNSKVLLMEDMSNEQKSPEEVKETSEISKGGAAVAEVKTEVDQLSEQVSALQAVVDSGTKVDNKDILYLIEMLIRQLLKLDGIEAEGEGKVQRKLEVRRVQGLVETMDILKSRNSNPVSNVNNTESLSTPWEIFETDSGSSTVPSPPPSYAPSSVPSLVPPSATSPLPHSPSSAPFPLPHSPPSAPFPLPHSPPSAPFPLPHSDPSAVPYSNPYPEPYSTPPGQFSAPSQVPYSASYPFPYSASYPFPYSASPPVPYSSPSPHVPYSSPSPHVPYSSPSPHVPYSSPSPHVPYSGPYPVPHSDFSPVFPYPSPYPVPRSSPTHAVPYPMPYSSPSHAVPYPDSSPSHAVPYPPPYPVPHSASSPVPSSFTKVSQDWEHFD